MVFCPLNSAAGISSFKIYSISSVTFSSTVISLCVTGFFFGRCVFFGGETLPAGIFPFDSAAETITGFSFFADPFLVGF